MYITSKICSWVGLMSTTIQASQQPQLNKEDDKIYFDSIDCEII